MKDLTEHGAWMDVASLSPSVDYPFGLVAIKITPDKEGREEATVVLHPHEAGQLAARLVALIVDLEREADERIKRS